MKTVDFIRKLVFVWIALLALNATPMNGGFSFLDHEALASGGGSSAGGGGAASEDDDDDDDDDDDEEDDDKKSDSDSNSYN